MTSVDNKFIWSKNQKNEKKHSFLLPESIRGLLIGKSNCGKTTLLNHLLLSPGVLDYDNLVVRGRSLQQPEYQVLQKALTKGLSKEQINVLYENQDEVEKLGGLDEFLNSYDGECPSTITCNFDSDVSNIPDPSQLNPLKKNLLVFDDLMLGPQNHVEKYFTRGRHGNACILYLSQSYFLLPRRSVRENSNIFFIFQQDNKNLSHIYQDLCTMHVDFPTFKRFCKKVWSQKYNFVCIDTGKPPNAGFFRRNLSDYWSPIYDTYYPQAQ